METETTPIRMFGKLALALSKAQAAMQPAVKNKENPFFKSKYADLSDIWESVRKPLSDNELCVIQTTKVGDGWVTLLTTLIHSSGEWISSEYPINPTKNDPQGIGSAITYARRYALAAITGASTEDDDGNSASQPGVASQTVASKPHIPFDPPLVGPPKPQAPKQGSLGDKQAAFPPTDWSQYQVVYKFPFKIEGKSLEEMDAIKAKLKEAKFRWNGEAKAWYGNSMIEDLYQFIQANPLAQPQGQQEEDPPYNY